MILKRCPTQLCHHRIPPRFVCCRDCWKKLPAGMRIAILTETDNCRAAGIDHSQELLALRDQAIEYLSRRNRERFGRPRGVQLRLGT